MFFFPWKLFSLFWDNYFINSEKQNRFFFQVKASPFCIQCFNPVRCAEHLLPLHLLDCSCFSFSFSFSHFTSLPSTGNSHVQWTVKEKICTLTLKYMHGHLHTRAYMRTVKTQSHYYAWTSIVLHVITMHLKYARHGWIQSKVPTS